MKEDICCWYESPVCMTFKIIALVVGVYGVWKHSWKLIVIAIVIGILGCLIKCSIKKNRSARKKRR